MSSLSLPDDTLTGEAGPGRRGVRYLLILSGLLGVAIVGLGLGAWMLWQNQQGVRGDAGGAVAGPVFQQASKPAPDFQLSTIDGKTIRLSDLRGQVVLLNFWATWCPPCRAEMPDLQALYAAQGRDHKFTILAVDVEETPAEASDFAGQYGLTFPVAVDTAGKVSNDVYGIRALPTSLIVDRAGNVRYRWSGGQSRQAMLKMLEQVWE